MAQQQASHLCCSAPQADSLRIGLPLCQCYNLAMQLNRDYRPRRRGKGLWRFWPIYLLIAVAIILYEQRPVWLIRQGMLPTPTPTVAAVAFLADAESALREGRFDEAIAALTRVVELEPDNADALIQLSRLSLMFLDAPAALRHARAAYEIDPDNPEALNTLARALDWAGEFVDALDAALDAQEVEPDNATTLAVLGEIYTDVGNWDVAQDYLDQALTADPQNVLALRNQAYLFEQRGDYEQAVAAYQKALDAAPNRFDLYIEKARQYRVGLLDYEAANEAYRRAVEVYRSPMTLDALGDGLYNAGDHLQAVRVLREAVEMNPEYGPAQVHLGMALYARRNYEDAVTALEKGLSLIGDAARVEQIYTAGLAYIYKDPPECDKGVAWLRKALAINPDAQPAIDGLRACGQA